MPQDLTGIASSNMEQVTDPQREGGTTITPNEMKQLKQTLLETAHPRLLAHEYAMWNDATMPEDLANELQDAAQQILNAREDSGLALMDVIETVGLRLNPASWIINTHLPFTLPYGK